MKLTLTQRKNVHISLQIQQLLLDIICSKNLLLLIANVAHLIMIYDFSNLSEWKYV